MKAIWKRELTSLFHNVIAWLFLGVTLFLFGLYFFVYNLNYGYPYIAYSLSAISFIFLITVPVLTMRVLAEERRDLEIKVYDSVSGALGMGMTLRCRWERLFLENFWPWRQSTLSVSWLSVSPR